jgi:hypothetical protein
MLGFLEHVSEDVVSLPGTFPLHKRVFSFCSKREVGIQGRLYEERGLPVAIEPEPL